MCIFAAYMIRWFVETLRDYKKEAIMKRFSEFSRFKGDSRVNEFRKMGRYLQSIITFSYKQDCLHKVLRKFNCIKIDDGWHIKQGLILKSSKAPYPLLYCHNDQYPVDLSSLDKRFMDTVYNGYDFRIKDNPLSIYRHLKVKPTAMGAWQVYLLEQYPFLNHWVNRVKCNTESGLVFSYADVRRINRNHNKSIENSYDLAPYVWMKDNVAYVTCCRWTDKAGLLRDIVTIEFKGDRVKDIMTSYETLVYSS